MFDDRFVKMFTDTFKELQRNKIPDKTIHVVLKGILKRERIRIWNKIEEEVHYYYPDSEEEKRKIVRMHKERLIKESRNILSVAESQLDLY